MDSGKAYSLLDGWNGDLAYVMQQWLNAPVVQIPPDHMRVR